jgi:hypothetical protein
MTNSDRARVILHGAIVLLVGLLCGYPAVAETGGGESARLWHTAHEGLIMVGVMLIAVSSTFRSLLLARREARALVWSLVATGYGLATGMVLQGITGTRAFGFTTSPVLMIAFLGNATGILGSILAALLTISGARAALKAPRAETGATRSARAA